MKAAQLGKLCKSKSIHCSFAKSKVVLLALQTEMGYHDFVGQKDFSKHPDR